jgi:multidrug resistance protein MdtO
LPSSGNLYGTILAGTASGGGVVFKLTGTGFGVIPVSAFSGKLQIAFGPSPNTSAWVAAGSPRVAYAGFQMAFAFFLCVIQGPGPSFDMTIARIA